MWSVVFIVALCVLSCSSVPPPLPQQFISNVLFSAGDFQNAAGRLWVDWTNKGGRFTIAALGFDGVVTPSNGNVSIFAILAGSCTNLLTLAASSLPAFALPANAYYVGSGIMNGISVQIWNGTDPTNPIIPIWQVYLDTKNNSFVQVTGFASAPGSPSPVPIRVQFSDTQLGPFDRSIYAKPSNCA